MAPDLEAGVDDHGEGVALAGEQCVAEREIADGAKVGEGHIVLAGERLAGLPQRRVADGQPAGVGHGGLHPHHAERPPTVDRRVERREVVVQRLQLAE